MFALDARELVVGEALVAAHVVPLTLPTTEGIPAALVASGLARWKPHSSPTFVNVFYSKDHRQSMREFYFEKIAMEAF